MKRLAVPLLTIAVGTGWLLTVQDVIPGIDWIWVLGLATVGVLTLGSGLDKLTLVAGPLLMTASVFSVLRQTGRMPVDVEVPSLVIVLGGLMLFVQVFPVPEPKWLLDPPGKREKRVD